MASGIIEKVAVYESYATESKENNDFSISITEYHYGNVVTLYIDLAIKTTSSDAGATTSITGLNLRLAPRATVAVMAPITVSASDRTPCCSLIFGADRSVSLWGRRTATRGGATMITYIV